MRKYIIVAFILVALIQLAVPLSMIWGRENIISEGETFKFQTQPIDPSDPFRGKYVRLRFNLEGEIIAATDSFEYNDEAYAVITTSTDGYAAIKSVTKDKPEGTSTFIKVKTRPTYSDSIKRAIYIEFPMDRFYMEEYKAPEAEKVYNQTRRDTSQRAYAIVNVLNGEAVVTDVMINDTSLIQVIESRR